MKAGVSTVPCASSSRPCRAAPSLPNKVNLAFMDLSRMRARRRGDEHRVTIAEEPVMRRDRVRIRGEHGFPTRECAHEHEQRGFWQMEVGDDRVDDAKTEA